MGLEGTGALESGLQTMVTNLVIAESQHVAIEEQVFGGSAQGIGQR